MHQINDCIVKDGQIVLSHLPFADGEHVQVLVMGARPSDRPRLPLSEVRMLLKGGVVRYDNPTDPVIDPASWEMLK